MFLQSSWGRTQRGEQSQVALRHYLDYGYARSNVDKQIGEDIRVRVLEAELRIRMPGINKGLVGDVLQNKVTALDKTGHLIFLVHPGSGTDI